jgi:hypothetical protein
VGGVGWVLSWVVAVDLWLVVGWKLVWMALTMAR